MLKANIIANSEFVVGDIDERIYGSFVEHMGRVVYTGIYEPEHKLADEDGFRTDVIEAVKNLGVTSVRYPGGNFVSNYDWKDGVGPKEDRPKRLEIAWRAVETNEFGTNEYMKWADKVGVKPMFAVNLGTKGIENALDYLEYCNFPGGTKYSDLRISHGIEKPYNIKTWCLGNEMDGEWQIGHKTSEEYGRLVRETAKAMKLIDPEIELVTCGSSLQTMDTYPEWEAVTLDHTYEYVDYISLHQYFAGQDKGTLRFLAQSEEMDSYIKTVGCVCDYIKAKKRSKKEMMISFDEWGVWSKDSSETVKECNNNPWQKAPVISEMIYTFEDSLLFASMLLVLLKNSDRVKMACQSLLTNISATIMTEKGGDVWLQPIYYPFAHAAKYGKGKVLEIKVDSECYDTEIGKVPYLDSVVVENAEEEEIVVFAVNRSEEDIINMKLNLQGYKIGKLKEHIVMDCEDKKMTNLEVHDRIKPRSVKTDITINNNDIEINLNKLSWNVIRIEGKAY